LTVKEPTFNAEAAVIKKRLLIAARPQDTSLYARTNNKKYVRGIRRLIFFVVFKHAHDGWFVVYSVNFLMGYFSLKSFFLCILFLLVKIRINLFQLCKSFHSFFYLMSHRIKSQNLQLFHFSIKKLCRLNVSLIFFSGVFTSFSIVCSKFVFLSIFSLLLGLYLFRGENTLRFFFLTYRVKFT
jgi:hypothetical protein